MFDRVRTRFAPSPTGDLHLGGLRTALYNYLFAQHHGGDFIVRFEDTDLERNKSNVEKKLLADLRWIGIQIAESVDQPGPYAPYRQSDRLAFYREVGTRLIRQKKAYYCFCTKEQLTQERDQQLQSGKKAPQYSKKCLKLSSEQVQKFLVTQKSHCIRLNIQPKQTIKFLDLVYGEMVFYTEHIEDFVLIKSDNYPTYNFAVVVDDHLMKISHIWRGSDHLSNTPKQILLYQTLDWSIPTFGHLTLIKTTTTTKMSKRRADPMHFLTYYIDQGYLPLGLANYLVLLGWCPDLTQEIFTMDEMIHLFDGQKLNRAQSVFDFGKLNWVNRQHLTTLSSKEFEHSIHSYALAAQNRHTLSKAQLSQMITTVRGQISYFAQIDQAIDTFFVESISYTPEQIVWLKTERATLATFTEALLRLTTWEEQQLGEQLQISQKESSLSKKGFFRLIKVVLTGKPKTFRLKMIIFLLGRDRVLRLLKQLLAQI